MNNQCPWWNPDPVPSKFDERLTHLPPGGYWCEVAAIERSPALLFDMLRRCAIFDRPRTHSEASFIHDELEPLRALAQNDTWGTPIDRRELRRMLWLCEVSHAADLADPRRNDR